MIYLVTKEQSLFELEGVANITVEESLTLLNKWGILQCDSETTGRDSHINKLLSFQFGNIEGTDQIVVDCTTISIKLYKDVLESKFLIFQNAKFDLQFLFSEGIVPRYIYDTMIVEQFLHLGCPSGSVSYSLASLCERYLNIHIDKTIRGEIIWRGLDLQVIQYAASDVKYLYQIMSQQLIKCREINAIEGAKLECNAVPAIAYMEWCGIKLDATKWKAKMEKDKANLTRATELLNSFIVNTSENNNDFKQFVYINRQGDLFTGFDLTPKCTINWDSPKQVVQVFKLLGFDTSVQDKKTGEDKDSVLEKMFKTQKGINDEFLKLYFDYKEYSKVCSTYGQGHLNMINPNTGRIHTTFKQLGASSGRMSCGSQQPNIDLAKLKGIKAKECTYCNLQQLPADEDTRSSFVAPEGYAFVSADFSGEESRLAADIYQDKEFLKEFLEGSGDTHSMFAWAVFREECTKCGCKGVQDIKSKAPQWRKAVKAVEFAYLFGAAAHTISQAASCSVEEAQSYIDRLDATFKGTSEFAKKGAQFVRKNGYILINPITGHRLNWWDHKEWLERQKSFTPEFWDNYRMYHKGTGDNIALEVRHHFQAASKYDRLARNSVTQGTGAIILKDAMTSLFNWIVDNGYFGIIHICVVVHDEINCDYPKGLTDFPKVLTTIMEESAAKYCKSLPIPAVAEVSDHWVH